MPPAAGYSLAELDLADRAREGDQEAMVELYQRYRQPIYRHAWRMLRSESAAQDVVQESFTRAIASISRTQARLKFKAWIFRIATNLCLRQLNQGKRVVYDADSCQDAEDTTADPESGQRRYEIASYAAAAVEQLPPKYKQILLLRELEELSYDELAEVMGLDRNRVKVTLHRARSRFAAHFIAARLLADSSLEVECDELRQALSPLPSPKHIIRHLESCAVCRKRKHRPAAELFSLLPAVPAAELPPSPSQAGSPVATAGAGLKIWGAVAAAAVACGVVAAVLLFRGGDAPASTPPDRTAAALRNAPAARPGAVTSTAPAEIEAEGAAARSAVKPAAARRAARTSRKHGRRSARAGGKKHTPSPAAAMLDARRRPAALPAPTPAKAPKSAAPALPHGSLKVRLWFTPGTVTVTRGSAAFLLRKADQLRIGDVLRTRGTTAMGIRFPAHQWIVCQGTARLDAAPLKGPAPGRVRLTLLHGHMRARATAGGRGITVKARGSTFYGKRGEFRIAIQGHAIHAESLSSHVEVSGAHASRQMPPRSRVVLGPRPGFAHGLLPPVKRLRPVKARQPSPPLLSWDTMAGARAYRVQIARDTDFMQVLQTHEIAGRAVRPASLSPGKYFWQVVATDGRNLGRPSKIYSFVITM